MFYSFLFSFFFCWAFLNLNLVWKKKDQVLWIHIGPAQVKLEHGWIRLSDCRPLHHLHRPLFSSVANFSSATSCVDRPSTLFKRGDLSPAAAEGGDPIRSAGLWWRARGAPGGPGRPHSPPPSLHSDIFSAVWGYIWGRAQHHLHHHSSSSSLSFSTLKQTTLSVRTRDDGGKRYL